MVPWVVSYPAPVFFPSLWQKMVAKVREWRHVYRRMGRPGGPYHLIDSQGSWKGWKGVLVPNSLYYHLVMTNIAMENPKNKWRFLAGKIIYLFLWAIYTMAMLNNQRVIFVHHACSWRVLCTCGTGRVVALISRTPVGDESWMDHGWTDVSFTYYPLVNIQKAIENGHL